MSTQPPAAPILRDVLERGYFPKELPPPFTTSTLAPVAAARGADFAAAHDGMKVARPCRYRFARPGSLRRTLSAPNPAFYHALADALCSRWAEVETLLGRSSLSISKPLPSGPAGRAIRPETAPRALFDTRCEYRGRFRYVLQADIAQFYPTIYTHSIP